MRRFHLAIAVSDLAASVADYTTRLQADPVLVIPGEYALWRTEALNVSIRQLPGHAGQIRHVGWEDDAASGFTAERDADGLLWEHFTSQQQAEEIRALWPDVAYRP